MATSASSLKCNSSFNPYNYSRAQVSACGYKTFALSSVTTLTGGGYRYNYTVNGTEVHFMVPPKAFNPTTASAAQLKEFGFPVRPANHTEAAARWQSEMGKWKSAATPPNFIAESHTRAYSSNIPNWSGYELESGQNNTFTTVQGKWIEPTFGETPCTGNEEVTWAGIGGGAPGDPLGQNGTAYNVSGLSAHQAWWEIVPGYFIMPINMNANPGIQFEAMTTWEGSGYQFFWYNSYSAQSVTLDVNSSTYSGDTAEVIAERPTIDTQGDLSPLSNFGTLSVTYSSANNRTFDNYSPTGYRYGIHMVDSAGYHMADPNTVSSGGSFTDTYHACN